MKIKLLLFLIAILSLQNFAQGEWMRVQSDNGEFSIEIPLKYNFVVDKDGYEQSESDSSTNYSLKNIKFLNSYLDKTLLTFEIYEGKKGALNAIYEIDKKAAEYSKKNNKSEIRENNLTGEIKEIIVKNPDYYTSRRYFYSKKYIYILTALTHDDENTVIKHFFDSLKFSPEAKQTDSNNGQLLSSLKTSRVEIVSQNVQPYIPDKNKKPDEPNEKKLIIAWKPRASYIDVARMRGVQGTIQMRCRFSEDGFIPRIEFIKILPEGLARQTLFALLRVKFLPKEIDGKPVTSDRVIEYKFTLY